MRLRLIILFAACHSLTSCGTASHYLGMASGLVNSVTSPVLGAIRLSDTPAGGGNPTENDAAAYSHDPRRTQAKRRY